MRSIRRDLALKMASAALALLLVGGLGLYFSLRKALNKQFDNILATKAEALMAASEVDDDDLEIDLDVQAFAGFGSSAPGEYFEVFNENGESVLRSPSLGTSSLTPPSNFLQKEKGFQNLTLPEGIQGRAYWITYAPDPDVGADEAETAGVEPEVSAGPEFRILVASSHGTVRRTLRTVAIFVGLFGLLGILLIVLLVNTVVRSGLQPLDRLSRDVQRIDVRKLTSRVREENLPQELQEVTAKLNELLKRLESSFTREKRFTADAAHELRTPLAELRAMTELGTQWPDEFTTEHGKEMLEVLKELEELLDTLSLLARAESDTSGSSEAIDLPESIREQLDRLDKEIERRNLKIELEVDEGEIHTDPVLWRAIVQNLVGNAVSYAPEGTTVNISASPDPTSLCVENEAPDLEKDDLPNLFARFWRKSVSRSDKGHSGLGLSVVRAAVEFLEGTCEAELEEGRLRMGVRWEK